MSPTIIVTREELATAERVSSLVRIITVATSSKIVANTTRAEAKAFRVEICRIARVRKRAAKKITQRSDTSNAACAATALTPLIGVPAVAASSANAVEEIILPPTKVRTTTL